MRAAAVRQIDSALDAAARAAAEKAVDDAMYALMQVVDGVTGGLVDDRRRLSVAMKVSLVEDGKTIESIDLVDGDGMCIGFHMWRDGDFGMNPVVSES